MADHERINDYLQAYLIDKLKIKIEHTQSGKLEIRLLLDETIISSDFIDYTEVIRIVEKENGENINNNVH